MTNLASFTGKKYPNFETLYNDIVGHFKSENIKALPFKDGKTTRYKCRNRCIELQTNRLGGGVVEVVKASEV